MLNDNGYIEVTVRLPRDPGVPQTIASIIGSALQIGGEINTREITPPPTPYDPETIGDLTQTAETAVPAPPSSNGRGKRQSANA